MYTMPNLIYFTDADNLSQDTHTCSHVIKLHQLWNLNIVLPDNGTDYCERPCPQIGRYSEIKNKAAIVLQCKSNVKL